MFATGAFAESITCPENTPSGTSCYQYTCGSNCTATLIGGAMTISGSGAMSAYSSSKMNMPWADQINNITSLTIENGISNVGKSTFAYASNLRSVSLPSTVTDIGNYSFVGTSNLTYIDIPDSVTRIGTGSFHGTGLQSVHIPDSVTSIEGNAFYNSQLTEVTFGENSQLTTIDNQAFYKTRNLKEIQLPASLKTIGNSAFANSGLELIDLGQATNLESIGRIAFCSETQNRVVILPDSDFTLADYEGYSSNFIFADSYCDSNDNCYTRYSSSVSQIYCAKGQEIGACDKSILDKTTYTKGTLAYEKVGDHYDIYDSEGNRIASYSNFADFGTNNVWKRTSYSPAEAAQHVNHTNNNKVIFTFK